jgi:hypothetical protein
MIYITMPSYGLKVDVRSLIRLDKTIRVDGIIYLITIIFLSEYHVGRCFERDDVISPLEWVRTRTLGSWDLALEEIHPSLRSEEC